MYRGDSRYFPCLVPQSFDHLCFGSNFWAIPDATAFLRSAKVTIPVHMPFSTPHLPVCDERVRQQLSRAEGTFRWILMQRNNDKISVEFSGCQHQGTRNHMQIGLTHLSYWRSPKKRRSESLLSNYFGCLEASYLPVQLSSFQNAEELTCNLGWHNPPLLTWNLTQTGIPCARDGLFLIMNYPP